MYQCRRGGYPPTCDDVKEGRLPRLRARRQSPQDAVGPHGQGPHPELKTAIRGAPSPAAGNTLSITEANAVRKHFGPFPTGSATGDMGDPHENLDQAGSGSAGADDTEGAGTTPPA